MKNIILTAIILLIACSSVKETPIIPVVEPTLIPDFEDISSPSALASSPEPSVTPEPTEKPTETPTPESISACNIDIDINGVETIYGPLAFDLETNTYDLLLRERAEPFEISFYSDSLSDLYIEDAYFLDDIFFVSDLDGDILKYSVTFEDETRMFKSKVHAEIGTSRYFSLREMCEDNLIIISDVKTIFRNYWRAVEEPTEIPLLPTDTGNSCVAPLYADPNCDSGCAHPIAGCSDPQG